MSLAHLLTGLLALAGVSETGGDRVEIPISQARFSNGPPRYSIPVALEGGAPIDAMLDTGSTGLNVLPSVEIASKPDRSARPARTSYRNGVVLTGVTAPTKVSLSGQLEVTAAVSRIQTVTCATDKPACPAAAVAPADYRIGATNPTEGFKAIIGVGLRAGAADNPLTKIGGQAWIVVLPRAGDPGPGKLILNPSPEERARFTLFQLPRDPRGTGWADNAVPACLTDDKAAPLCGPALLDSGAPSIVYISRTPPQTTWDRGAQLGLTFGPPAASVLKQSFTVGRGPGTRVEVQPPPANLPWEGLNLGALPFYEWAVLYDAKTGVVGLAPRDAFVAP